ncbi:MAG TPA: hypothetical protein VG895_03710 [Patescibacteria group bacterium]|nr:hypothetical protein [Patescibacteria group bacterium]
MSKKLPSQTYHDLDIEFVRNKLKLKAINERAKLFERHPQATKFLGTAAIASTLFLTAGKFASLPPADIPIAHADGAVSESGNQVLLSTLKAILPAKVSPLTADQENKLATLFKSVIGISAKANLEGEHLNTTYGLIGAEQHLRRYPGDTISQHADATGPYDEGMAPGLGAWGYFAPSKDKLTPDLVEDEKWYAVVQTLYLPDWDKRTVYLRDWYKYRKVLIVNTLNGNAVVADIADSGPASWTGKSFGGSPAVMNSLGGAKYKVGPVVLFFVDDPDNTIPLGPVDYNNVINNYAIKSI